MKLTATRRLQFSAGHRVYGHESKCANIHGHNYVVFLTAEIIDMGELKYADTPFAYREISNQVDSIGRVIDFSVLKEKFGSWIDRCWDHGMLYYSGDKELMTAMHREELGTMKAFICPFNPTAEEMARYLLYTIGPNLLTGTGVKLVRVVLWETENCFSEVSL